MNCLDFWLLAFAIVCFLVIVGIFLWITGNLLLELLNYRPKGW